MKSKCLFSLAAIVLASGAVQARVTLSFTTPGAYVVTVSSKASSTTRSAAGVNSLDVTDILKAHPGKWTATVQDTSAGNEGSFSLPATGTMAVSPDMLTTISRVAVTVTDTKGAKPDVAVITLRDGKGKSQTVTVLPQDGGRAVFQRVASGDGSVRVEQGSPKNYQTETVRLSLQRTSPVLEITLPVSLPDGLKVSGGTTGAPSSETGRPAPISFHHGFLTGILGFLIALAVLIGGLVYLVRYLRDKGVTAKSALAAAGVQLPDDPEPIKIVEAAAPEPVDPTICPFCGAHKDPNGPCPNCSVTARSQPLTASPSTGPARLVCLSGPKAGSTFPVTSGMTIGRDPSRDVAITDDASLSRQHATLEAAGNAVTVVDGGSSNGTWVNGRKVTRQALRPGDEIRLGVSTFRFEA